MDPVSSSRVSGDVINAIGVGPGREDTRPGQEGIRPGRGSSPPSRGGCHFDSLSFYPPSFHPFSSHSFSFRSSSLRLAFSCPPMSMPNTYHGQGPANFDDGAYRKALDVSIVSYDNVNDIVSGNLMATDPWGSLVRGEGGEQSPLVSLAVVYWEARHIVGT